MESVLLVMEINKTNWTSSIFDSWENKIRIRGSLEDQLFFISFLQTTFWGLSKIMRTRIFSSRIYWSSSPNGLCTDAWRLNIFLSFPTNVYAFTHVYIDRQTLARRRLMDACNVFSLAGQVDRIIGNWIGKTVRNCDWHIAEVSFCLEYLFARVK